MAPAAPLRPPAVAARSGAAHPRPERMADRPAAAVEARRLGRAHARPHGLLRTARGGDGALLPGGRARLGRPPVSAVRSYDIVVVGSGAGGGTVAQALAPLV